MSEEHTIWKAVMAARLCPRWRRWLRSAPKTDEDFIKALMKRRLNLRQEAAKWSHCPSALLRALAKDPVYDIRICVAAHPGTPEDVLISMAENARVDVAIGIELATRSELPKRAAELLAHCSVATVREFVAGRTDLSPGLYALLAKDQNARVRHVIAGNSSVPASVLSEMLTDSCHNVRAALARNPTVPFEVAKPLIHDPDPAVRGSLANRPDLPVDMIHHLGNDAHFIVRSTIAARKDAPTSVLEQLSKDDSWSVRLMVARNASAPESAMLTLAAGTDVPIKFDLVNNPAVTLRVLRVLYEQYNHALVPAQLRDAVEHKAIERGWKLVEE